VVVVVVGTEALAGAGMEAVRREVLARAGMVVVGMEALAGAGMEAARREALARAGMVVAVTRHDNIPTMQRTKMQDLLQGSCCLDVLGILSILISLPLGI
jgi:hypothetical protein